MEGLPVSVIMDDTKEHRHIKAAMDMITGSQGLATTTVTTLSGEQPVTTITKRPDGTEEWGGYEYKLFEAAAKHLKFDFDIGPPLVCCVWGKGCGKFMTITEILSTIETAYKVTGYSYKV